eukprot:gene10832-11983_t
MRPKAIAELLSSLNLTNVFQQQLKIMPEASEMYSEKDIKDLQKIHNEVQEWLNVNWKKQNETSLKVKPTLLVKDISAMQGKLDRELLYLINKAKYFVPKPKPKANKTDAANKTSSNDTKSSKDEKTAKPEDVKPAKDKDSVAKPDDNEAEKNVKANEKEADKTEASESEAGKKDEVEKEATDKSSSGKQEESKTATEESKTEKKAEKLETSSDTKSDESDSKQHKEL